MRKTLLLGCLAALFSGAALAGPTVNGQTISDGQINALIKSIEANGQKVTDPVKKEIIDQMIDAELLRQEAVKQGLDQTEDFKNELENLKTQALARHYLEQYKKTHPISEEAIKAFYDKKLQETPETKQFKAQHILVKTKAEAESVLNSLKKGKSFSQLAKQYSIDAGSKDKGGDLGWQESKTYVPAFANAIEKLKKGQVTAQPVKTEYGWHIIKLEDSRQSRDFPPLKDIHDQLARYLQSQAFNKFITDLKAKATIKN